MIIEEHWLAHGLSTNFLKQLTQLRTMSTGVALSLNGIDPSTSIINQDNAHSFAHSLAHSLAPQANLVEICFFN